MDERAKKLAEVLLKYSLNLKKGDKVLLSGSEAVIPFIREAYRTAIEIGANPIVDIILDGTNEIKLKHGTDEQIGYISEGAMKTIETVDAVLTVWGENNTRALTSVPAEKMKLRARLRKPYMAVFNKRLGNGEMKWCGTQFPTHGDAQEASMSLEEYEDFVYGAGHINSSDPVEHWVKIKNEQDRLCGILNTKKKIRIVSKDTDISMSVKNRTWINCSGNENFPDGEVFTSPVEDSVNGYIRFSFPGIYSGREIEDIRLRFENGKVVEAHAAKGEELLLELLDSDDGSKILGEVAVGTNYDIRNFTRNMLFDEKIGGTVHLAVGKGFPEAGSMNDSVIHWDMLCDMMNGGVIYADDQIIYKDGKFTI